MCNAKKMFFQFVQVILRAQCAYKAKKTVVGTFHKRLGSFLKLIHMFLLPPATNRALGSCSSKPSLAAEENADHWEN